MSTNQLKNNCGDRNSNERPHVRTCKTAKLFSKADVLYRRGITTNNTSYPWVPHTHMQASTAPVYFTGTGLFLCWPYLSLPAVVIEECLFLPLLLSVTANTSGQVLALLCHSNTHRQRCRSCNPESMSWLSVYPPPHFPPYIILLFIPIM